jgi:hypothetical protein
VAVVAAGLMPIPPESQDAALQLSLPPGNYVARVVDAGVGSGIGMIEMT